MSNELYDFLKRLVQVILPAIGALYFGLASIWNLPAAEQVVGTLAVLATFLGVTLGISTSRYEASERPYDGNMVYSTNEMGKKLFTLELDIDPADIESKDRLVFRTKELDPEAYAEDYTIGE